MELEAAELSPWPDRRQGQTPLRRAYGPQLATVNAHEVRRWDDGRPITAARAWRCTAILLRTILRRAPGHEDGSRRMIRRILVHDHQLGEARDFGVS